RLSELQAIRAQAQADYKESEMVLKQLTQLPPNKLKTALLTIIPDVLLEDLFKKVAEGETELAAMKVNLGSEHPDVKKSEAVIKILNEQMDRRVEGLVTGLQV